MPALPIGCDAWYPLVVSFDPERLCAQAAAATGETDFGDPTFREGLEALCDALRRAPLDEIGVQACEGAALGYLVERLRIEAWHRTHPEIGTQAIVAPILVTGLPRTGTSALSNLLAADPAARSLRYWESRRPTPPPDAASYWTDERIALGDAELAMIKAAAPALAAMHDDIGTSPTEHQDLLGQHFRTQHFEGQADVPDYVAWWLACDMVPAYRHHRRVLQLLQWRCPPTRWNLKSPPDLAFLEAFVAVYPDAKIVWTHRDPVKVLPSVCTLIATVRSLCCRDVDALALGRAQVALWAEGTRRGMAARRRLGESRFVDVFMDDLVADPIATLRAVYAQLALPFGPEVERAMTAWHRANPQHKHGAPPYDAAAFGLDRDAVRDAFRHYTDHFAVRQEA